MAQAKKYQLKKLFTMRSTRPFLLFDSFLVYVVYLIGVSLSPWAGQIFASSEIYVTVGIYALTVAIVSLGLGIILSIADTGYLILWQMALLLTSAVA